MITFLLTNVSTGVAFVYDISAGEPILKGTINVLKLASLTDTLHYLCDNS